MSTQRACLELRGPERKPFPWISGLRAWPFSGLSWYCFSHRENPLAWIPTRLLLPEALDAAPYQRPALAVPPTQPLAVDALPLFTWVLSFPSLAVSSLPKHPSGPPSSFLSPAAVGIQMQADYLQRQFWAAMRQVGQLGAQKRGEDCPHSPAHP